MSDTLLVAPGHAVPSYRDALTPGVAHIGVGGFHRAHQGTCFHELAELGITDWGIVGIGLRTRGTMEALAPQDLVYTVVERGADGDAEQVVGTLVELLHAPDDPEEVYAALADPAIRLVTLTVTGDGYHVDPGTLEFQAGAEPVQADLEGPDCCATFAAYLVEALERRRRAGVAPFTVLSCDNVPCNGEVTRAAVVGFARLVDPELAAWIDAHVAFPSSMVDRITPQCDGGAADPVVTEPFRQWVVEDAFCNERPPLELAGVQFVDDVAPYEVLKKRLLNGTHSAIAYLGRLAGCRTTDDVLDDDHLRAFVTGLVGQEIAPLVPHVPGIDLAEYTDTLLERLSNPRLGDELARLGRRGSTKVPSYLLPSLAEAHDQGRPRALLTLAVAGWVRALRCDPDVEDARLGELRPLARDPRRFAAERSVVGRLAGHPAFADELARSVDLLEAHGPRGAIERTLA